MVVHLGLGVAYQCAVPLFEGPDETSHIEYMAFLAEEHRIPLYGAQPEVPGEGMQAPLYYLLGAPLYAILAIDPSAVRAELHRMDLALYGVDRSRFRENRLVRIQSRHVRGGRWFDPEPELAPLLQLRWLSRLFGAVAVLLTFLAARRAFGDEALATVAALLLGFNPQFLFVSSCVSNDAAAACVGAATMWLVVGALGRRTRRRRDYLGVGLLGVVGLLTKTSTLPGLFVAAVALFSTDPRPLGVRLRDAALGFLPSLALAAPYLAWNALYRGDPLGVTSVLESAAELVTPEAFGGFGSYFTWLYPYGTFTSYWAVFGWMELSAPTAIQLAYLALTCIGVLGLLLRWRKTPHAGAWRLGALDGYLLAAVGATVVMHLWLNLQSAQPQGRHLFPSAPQGACLLAMGLRGVLGREPTRLGWPAAAALLTALAGLALYCLLGVLGPAYA